MSFCPTNCPIDDIHSLYLDNEMPDIYKKEYEEHIKSCEKCQNKLNKMKKLQSLFNDDAKALNVDSHFMDQSFERLQMKMRYSKNTGAAQKNSSANKFVIPSFTVAAAAMLVAVVVPLKVSGSTASAETNNVTPVAVADSIVSRIPTATDVSLGSGRSVVISGNIHESVLPAATNDAVKVIPVENANSYTRNATTVDSKNLITNYEVFSPDFGNSNNISIKITIPGVHQNPVSTEIELPLNVIVGQY